MSKYFYFLIYTTKDRTHISVQELSHGEHTKSKEDYDIVNEITYNSPEKAITNAKRIAETHGLCYEPFSPRYIDSPFYMSKEHYLY